MIYLISLTDTDFADVACKELGYERAEEVEYIGRGNVGFSIGARSYQSLMNPKCSPKTTKSMEFCDYYRNQPQCGSDKDVYVKCQG